MSAWTCIFAPVTSLANGTGITEAHRPECEENPNTVVRYIVDNSTLQTSSPGLAYRNSKVITDKSREELAPWGTEVAGVDTGDGWLQVGAFFLPFAVEGSAVLKVSGRGYATGQCLTCSHFGRNPFFCFYNKVREGACITVNAEFESINRDRNTLKPGMRGVVLEVDADDDRRIQFEGFEKAQWVAFHKLLFLTITKEGQAGEVKEAKAILASGEEEGSDIEEEAPVRYSSYTAWLFGQPAPKDVRCPDGHTVTVFVSEEKTCNHCGGLGVHYQCCKACDWHVCYLCYKSIPGLRPTLDGKWIKGEVPNEEIEVIQDDKVTFARGESQDLKLLSDSCCELVTDGVKCTGTLFDSGMTLNWTDGDVWTRSLRDDYIQMRPKLNVHESLKAMHVPTCPTCGSATRWKSTPENERWTCINYTTRSCGAKGCSNRFPWRWFCQQCSYNLCSLCGPQVPTTLETLRPQTVPITEEWVTAGSKALMSDAGCYYHEVRLGQGLNSPHIGWLTHHFAEKEFDGHGVGTNAHGWAADGVRHKKWHCGCVDAAWPREWQEGDIIGCAIDITGGSMNFSLNGEWVNEATMLFQSMNRFFFPAVSMNGDFEFNAPRVTWQYSPPREGYESWAEGGKYSRPKSSDLGEGDRVCIQESCMSNSRDPTRLQKGQLGTVRTIDEDGDALIDFDENGKGEWIFRTCFERLRILDLMRDLIAQPVQAAPPRAPEEASTAETSTTVLTQVPTVVTVTIMEGTDDKVEIESKTFGRFSLQSGDTIQDLEEKIMEMAKWTEVDTFLPNGSTATKADSMKDHAGGSLTVRALSAPAPKGTTEESTPAPTHAVEKREQKVYSGNGLVGIWDFAGGTFDVEDQNGKLFFYGSELKPEEGSGWMLTKLPKTGVSYRLRLNRPKGNVLVWQEMGKGGDAWEATHYATRRGRMSDGAQIVTTMQASIWGSAHSGHELGLAPGGAALVLAGPRVQGDGLWMAPVRPRGAVELRCIRLDEPLDDDIEAVDTNSLSGHEGQKYDSLDSVWEALEDGDTQLIKGSWLRLLADKDGVLPRRQELPAEAAWEPVELQRLVEQRRVQIVAVSYCWLTAEHPDPKGSQLKTVANVIDQRLDEVTIPLDDLAVFIDWGSLYQSSRTDEEEEAYRRGFKAVNLWYAHAQIMAWLLTVVPEGVTPFASRGWPTFERAVSVMLTESSKLLDLGKLNDTCTRWFQTCKICTMQRQPPLVPDAFDVLLKTKQFALETDRPAVERKYAQTFHEVMASAKFLEFQALGWDPTQVACFAEAFPYCRSLTKLTLTENEVGTARKAACCDSGEQNEAVIDVEKEDKEAVQIPEPVAARALAMHLPKVNKLRQILCRGCNIGDEDMVILAQALPRCMALVTLNLQDNKIGARGTVALAKVLPDCERLGLLYLASNKVGEEGALALAKYAPNCDTLRELWVTDAGDMGEGKQVLIEEWRDKGKAEGFLHL
jgi:hypothetical protein